MSEPTPAPMPMLEQLVLPAEGCEGDACVVPTTRFQESGGRMWLKSAPEASAAATGIIRNTGS